AYYSCTVSSLALSHHASLTTDESNLTVTGMTLLDPGDIYVQAPATPGSTSFETGSLRFNGGGLVMRGGTARVNGGTIIGSQASLKGHGLFTAGNTDAAPEKALDNSGAISVERDSYGPATLTLKASGVDT